MTAPARVLVFQSRFQIGGQERQTLLNVRTMARGRWEPVVAVLHAGGDYLLDLDAMGIRPTVFDLGSSMLRANTGWQVARLVRFIRARRIALVHAQDLYTNLVGTAAARLAGVPSIVTRVDLNHDVVGFRGPLQAFASRRADRVLVNALCIRDLVVGEGVEPDRVAVVRNGVDLEALDAASREEPQEPAPAPGAIVCVSNMHHPVKGQTDLLVAMREIASARPGSRLVLVGDGQRRPLLERTARQLGIAGSCHFLGHRHDVPSILARASIAVSPSHAEGISNSILEEMALRLPVVATAVGGTPELVRDGVNGFLVPPGAPAALAGRIGDLLAAPRLRRRMGERGRKIVERDFGLARMRASYDALYEELVGPRLAGIAYGIT